MIDYKTNLNCNLNEFHNWNITAVCGRLVQVRANKGGGTRNIRVPAMATKREIVAEAQKLFFPAGVSGIGNQADFAFDLVDV